MNALVKILNALTPFTTPKLKAYIALPEAFISLYQGWNNVYKETVEVAMPGSPLRKAMDSYADDMEKTWHLIRGLFNLEYPTDSPKAK
mgnify:CR=1 FL=1